MRFADNALVHARSASHLKGIFLHCEVEPELPLLDIDGVQTERVISNLLSNAIKFTPSGGGVSLNIQRCGNTVQLSVSDTGPGIEASELPYLFDKYHREPHSRRIEGSGLGLFIVRTVVQAHGGTVELASKVGKGTTVTVSFPIDTAEFREPPSHQPWRSADSPLRLATTLPAGTQLP